MRSGAKLFSSYYDAKVNKTINAVLSKLNVPHAQRYSSHGFRRGAANELKTSGSQWSLVATLGDWRSLALRGYVDVTPEMDRDMANLLIETEDIDSDLNDEAGTLGAGAHLRPESDYGRWYPEALNGILISAYI